MVLNPFSGPNLTFGLTRSASGGIQEYNEQRAPDISDAGYSLYDPRPVYGYAPGSGVTSKTWGWWNSGGRVELTPGTFTAVTLATTQVPVSGTALTLQTASSGCVTAGVTLVPASNPQTTVTGLLAIDSTYATVPSGLACGQAGTITMWNPALALGRTIMIEKLSTLDDTAATYTIQGYDIYGYKLTETITGTSSTGSTQYQSQKAFKYIQSITPGGTIGATGITVHPTNTYGFPLAVRSGWQASLWLGLSSAITAVAQSTLITYASTVTATATTPDVRGTWQSTNLSSNSSNVVMMHVTPRAQDVTNMTGTYLSTGYWLWLGMDQYSS